MLLRLALLGLVGLLQIRPVLGQSQLESAVCTIKPRTDELVGLTSTPEDDGFGIRTSLSQDGTIAAIGASHYSNDTGYVQVFRFENNLWAQLRSTIFGELSSWTSINALSDDGSILAVGGANASYVQVFSLVDDNWESLGNNITNPSGENIGYAIDISGDGTILAASNPFANSDAGEARVFELVGGTWIQKGLTLQGQDNKKYFGHGISLSQDGSRLAVGIPDTGFNETIGCVRVFEFINNNWVQIGQALEGASDGERFGVEVSLSSDGRTLAVGAPFYNGNSDNLGSVHVYHFGSDGQWFEPGSMLIGKSFDEKFGQSLALSGDASILVVRGTGLMRFFEAYGNDWIEVRAETTDSSNWNYAAISRDGSTAIGGASVFDISCPQPTTPNPATASPVHNKSNSIGVIVGASIGGVVFLAIAIVVGIRANKRMDDAGESVTALQRQGTPVESGDQMTDQWSQHQSLPYAAGVIVYDGHGEVLEPFTHEAQAVLLASDNPTTMQNVTTEVQTPRAGWLQPSPPQQAIDTPMPEPLSVFTPSDGNILQFKDQTRSASPERHGQRDP